MSSGPSQRVVYLNDRALQIIVSQSQTQTDRTSSAKVFDASPDYVTQQFKKVCEDVGLENFRFHDLRHTSATLMRMSGAGIDVIAELLGHSDLRMAKRYQHLSPEFLLKAVSGLDRAFEGIDFASSEMIN